jgi:hypothetical protein
MRVVHQPDKSATPWTSPNVDICIHEACRAFGRTFGRIAAVLASNLSRRQLPRHTLTTVARAGRW